MNRDNRNACLNDLYEFQYGTGNTIENIGGDYPIYGSNGPVGYTNTYNSEDAPVIGHIGAYAGIVNWASGKHFVTYNGVICKIKTGINPRFGYYVLLNSKIQNNLRGSTQPFISYDLLNDIKVYLPKRRDQDLIASILSALDSKIELNNRINAELEVMAKTIYDYWFVQFDFPDKNGKPYKSSGGKMVWNDNLKRQVPEGWEVNRISKMVKIGSGFPFDSDNYNNDGAYKIITIKNVQDGFLDTSSVDKISSIPSKISDFCILKKGDILMSLTGNVGRMCFVDQNNLLLNQRVGKLLGEKDIVIYAYFFFKRPENQQRLSKIANGSSQANLSPIEAVKDCFIIPPQRSLDLFSELIYPIIDKFLINNIENQKLAELRDWLLPMLMNGQVKVN